jgi:hypothetical protein
MACASDERIASDMTKVHAAFAGSEAFGVELIIDDDHAKLRRCCLRDVALLLLDGHGDGLGTVCDIDLGDLRDAHGHGIRTPIVALGGCWAGRQASRERLRRSLDKPTVVVACRYIACFKHGPQLWPYVLRGLGELAGKAFEPEQLGEVVRSWLGRAIAEQPEATLDGKWDAYVLHPLP